MFAFTSWTIAMPKYIHELSDWPGFFWGRTEITALLIPVRHHQGVLMGKAESIGFQLRRDALAETLSQDVLKTSEIEGELLDAEQVRSSVGRRLGLDRAALPLDRRVEGIVDVVLDATQRYNKALTESRLFDWHTRMLAAERGGLSKVVVGAWRTGPMQVVSGPLGSEYVHFEAPGADLVPLEMERFLHWFNKAHADDEVLVSAIAHLWFVTIHPFDDGNGRIARAIADLALARSEGMPQRFYSMSAQIRRERTGYYDILQQTQQGTLDITEWLRWYLECLDRAISSAELEIEAALAKHQFWTALVDTPLNDRQRQMLNRLVDGFVGKLTTSKWAALAKTSQDTALRDISDLLERGILVREASGGRSTSYVLAAFGNSSNLDR
jgi:Fic family protein